MTATARIFYALLALTFISMVLHSANADEKKKKIIIKVPYRIKHIYHHHTKKIHIHKPKPKPKEHVHVVVEEEEIGPIKGWPKQTKHKGWTDWKPKGFSHQAWEESSEEDGYGESSSVEEDYYRGEKRNGKGKKRSQKYHSSEESDEPYYVLRPKYKSKKTSRRPSKRLPPTKYMEYYDDLYERGSVWPEVEEHPSWRNRRVKEKDWVDSRPAPDVIEDTDDVDPPFQPEGVYSPAPEQYKPVYDYRTITSSGAQQLNHGLEPAGFQAPPAQRQVPEATHQLPKKSTGHHSQISQNGEGQAYAYQSHVGHTSDTSKPSSSFQSVTFGAKL